MSILFIMTHNMHKTNTYNEGKIILIHSANSIVQILVLSNIYK